MILRYTDEPQWLSVREYGRPKARKRLPILER